MSKRGRGCGMSAALFLAVRAFLHGLMDGRGRVGNLGPLRPIIGTKEGEIGPDRFSRSATIMAYAIS